MIPTDTAPRADRIVVAGLPRSGTTYVGKILDQLDGVRMVLEPLNEEFGLRGVGGQFPYAPKSCSPGVGDAERLFSQMVELRGGWRRLALSRGENRSGLAKAAKLLIGSRTSWYWRVDRFAERVRHPLVKVQCFKDPFATFALGYLAERHGIRSVCMVRHPGAYYTSFVAQPWEFGVTRLANASAMRADLGSDIDDSVWSDADQDKLVYCAVMWKLMTRYLATQKRSEILVMRHEDFSADIPEHMQQIVDHFGLQGSLKMTEFITSTSSGSAVAPEYLQVNSFFRNSSAVAGHWRSTIDPDVADRLETLVGDDINTFYEGW